jgi:hypothetical protein
MILPFLYCFGNLIDLFHQNSFLRLKIIKIQYILSINLLNSNGNRGDFFNIENLSDANDN